MNDELVQHLFNLLGDAVLLCPAALLVILGASSLFGHRLSERAIGRLTQTFVIAGLLAAIGVLAVMLISGQRLVALTLGDWIVLPHLNGGHDQPFHFTFK